MGIKRNAFASDRAYTPQANMKLPKRLYKDSYLSKSNSMRFDVSKGNMRISEAQGV